MPGPIWQSVSFPLDRDITDNEIYLFVVVLFFVDKNLLDGEPRVWNQLNAAWDENSAWPRAGDQHGTTSAMVPLSSGDSSVIKV